MFAVWPLPPGVVRSREENNRNTYLVFTHPDPKGAHATLSAAGADVGPLTDSEHHSFFGSTTLMATDTRSVHHPSERTGSNGRNRPDRPIGPGKTPAR